MHFKKGNTTSPSPWKDPEIKGGPESRIKGKDNKHLILSLHSFRSAVCQSITQGPCSP